MIVAGGLDYTVNLRHEERAGKNMKARLYGVSAGLIGNLTGFPTTWSPAPTRIAIQVGVVGP